MVGLWVFDKMAGGTQDAEHLRATEAAQSWPNMVDDGESPYHKY
jgi:hypothetical protein